MRRLGDFSSEPIFLTRPQPLSAAGMAFVRRLCEISDNGRENSLSVHEEITEK
jgi:hypothetical protein